MSSPWLFVHAFPQPNDDFGLPRLQDRSLSCLLTIASGGFSIGFLPFFSFSRSSGFYPPLCYQRFFGPDSSVLPVNLPPFAPYPASVSPSRFGFMKSLAPLEFQCRRASLGKMHQPPCIPSHFTADRFTGYQVLPSHDGSTSSPRPFSRFAVRYVHSFCLMLPLDSSFLRMPLPCWRCPSVR